MMTIRKLKVSNFKIVAIVNLTPNSFSDGGKISNSSDFKKTLNTFFKQKIYCVDIGAESTAPFNQAIGLQEELDRFDKYLIPYISDGGWDENVVLSIDTYRFETFKKLYDKILQFNPNIKLIWNDVSGIFEDGVGEFLSANCPNAKYVFSHTLNKERSQSSSHLQRILTCNLEGVVKEVGERFIEASSYFNKYNLNKRIIFDPCFGFSKTREQNLYLIDHLKHLITDPHFLKDQKWLLGISKKSFLREEGSKDFEKAESLHVDILSKWMQEMPRQELLFRVHDPNVVIF